MNYIFHNTLTELLPEIPENSIVSRTVHNDDKLKVTLFGFAAGQELTEHTASKPALIQIISGQGRLTLGTETFDVQAGTWVHMEPHLPHALLAESPVVMLLTMLK